MRHLLAVFAVAVGGWQSPSFQDATTLLERYIKEQKIAGAVAAVARAGKVEYLEAVGVQDGETRAPMTERTLFRIYSMTKPIPAVAAMMLIEEGRASLSDPVSKYLPEFKQVAVALPDGTTRLRGREITVEDLLLHTSGLSHGTSELYRRLQLDPAAPNRGEYGWAGTAGTIFWVDPTAMSASAGSPA